VRRTHARAGGRQARAAGQPAHPRPPAGTRARPRPAARRHDHPARKRPPARRHEIPIRTFTEWTDARPGFLEVDLVAHCGSSTEGFYLCTLCAVDIATAWIELEPVWGKGQVRVGGAVDHVRTRVPMPLVGLDSDSTSSKWRTDTYFKTQLFYELTLQIIGGDAKTLAEQWASGHEDEVTDSASDAFRRRVEPLLNHPTVTEMITLNRPAAATPTVASPTLGPSYWQIFSYAKGMSDRSALLGPHPTVEACRSVQPFTDKQIELLQTFADQAVIAIENVRLFQELQTRTGALARSVERLTALGEVSQAVSSTLDLQTVLDTIVARAVQLSGGRTGVIFEYDEATQEVRLPATHRMERELVELFQVAPIHLGEGATGQAAAIRAPVQVRDHLDEREYAFTRLRPVLARLGYRSGLVVPLLLEQRIMGTLGVLRPESGDFSPEVVELLQTFAAQSVLAIQNARLFLEIEDKSRQLEAASRHKSEFLANMSTSSGRP
jgi:GAF domain-containing protein